MAAIAVWKNMYLDEPMMKTRRSFIETVSVVLKPVLSVSEKLAQVIHNVLFADADICI